MVADAPVDDAVARGYVDRARTLAETVTSRAEERGRAVFEERRRAAEAFVGTENFDRALRLFEDLPPGFAETSWAARVEEERGRILEARDRYLREEALRRDEGWTYLFTASTFDGWTKRGNATWDLVEDTLGYSYLAVRNGGPGDSILGFAAPGCESWGDYTLRVDLRGVEGDLVVYVRGPGGASGVAGIRVPAKLIPRTDGWWTLQVTSAGDECQLMLEARVVKRIRNPAGLRGGIGFGVAASCGAQIRNVRVKLAP
jgi:hypothetical protein